MRGVRGNVGAFPFGGSGSTFLLVFPQSPGDESVPHPGDTVALFGGVRAITLPALPRGERRMGGTARRNKRGWRQGLGSLHTNNNIRERHHHRWHRVSSATFNGTL